MKLNNEQNNLIVAINKLKRKKNAIILCHNYQRPEIFEAADYIGDSLGLCLKAMKSTAKIIIFCGVHFMAESAAILNPNKKIIVPTLDAGCAMADMVSVEKIEQLKKKYPDAAIVTYVNSTAEIKAISDFCCTSSNAVKVISLIPNKKIIFVPDKNLASYVASQVPEKQIIPYDGYCPIHHFVDKEYLDEVRIRHPKTKIIVHPESKPEIIKMADYVSSTSGMIDCVKKDGSQEFFVLTECGMINRLEMTFLDKKFYGVCNFCFDMKKNTLQLLLECLEREKPVVTVDEKIAKKARKAFENMFKLTA